MTQTPRIAITGGIGSGKSFVIRQLQALTGEQVYDCDSAAKRLMCTSEELKAQLTALIGPDTYVDGVLNKAAVAQFLLSSQDHAQQIDQIVHPAVAKDFLHSGMRWMECAILFESGFDKLVDMVICVTAPLEVRIQRVTQRDNISDDQVKQWMGRQMDPQEVAARSQYVVVNDGIRDIQQQLKEIINNINIKSCNRPFFP